MPAPSGQKYTARLWNRAVRSGRRLRADALIRRLLRNAGMLLGGKAAGILFTLGYLAFAARGLGLEHFGTLVLIQTFIQAVGRIVTFKAWHAVLTYGTPAWQESNTSDLRRVLWFTLKLDLAGALCGVMIVVAGAGVAGGLFGWPDDVVPLVQLYGLSILFMAKATSLGILRLFDRFDFLAGYTAVAPIIQFIGSGIAYWQGAAFETYLIILFVATAAAGIVLTVRAWLELRSKGVLTRTPDAPKGRWKPNRKVWRFVWSTNFASTLELSFTHFGTLCLGAIGGPQAAALYRVARQIGSAIAGPAGLLMPAVFPELSRLLHDGDLAVLRRYVFRTMLLAGIIAGALVGGLAVAGGWLLVVIAGQEFLAAYPVMMWLAAAAAVRFCTLPLEPLIIASGAPHRVLAVRTVNTFVYLILLFPLIGQFGVVGAGVAVLIARSLNAACFFALSRRIFLRNQAASG